MAEEKEKGIVKYQARDGQEISLGFEIVRTYLVAGKKELVTPQELMFFMGICKSRGLNPFKRDAYLIKYSEDPAAIVTSIDFYRSRARAQKDCQGWKSGIVIDHGQKNLEYREGALLLENEKLVGGWFEAKPAGWEMVLKHSVSLKPYVKKTRDGNVTQFWKEDNQPSQIMKVAESQGLRRAWPDEFQQMYTEEEILPQTPTMDDAMQGAQMAEEEKKAKISKFNASWPKDAPELLVDEFLEKTAQANRVTREEAMIMASDDLERFWVLFEKFKAKKVANGEAKREEGAMSGERAPKTPARESQTAPPLSIASEGNGIPGGKVEETALDRVRFIEKTYPKIFKAACGAANIPYPLTEEGAMRVRNEAIKLFRAEQNKK
jgi:phage recombination protein Bet